MLTAATIQGFVGSLLQKNFDGAVDSPACHMEWWELCCSKNPKVAIAAPRRHAKSTAITFAYATAVFVFRERQYGLIVSDTLTQAIQFLSDIKKELAENEQLRALFKIREFIKDSEDDVIVACEDGHMFRIQAKGSEQKLRGLKWNNKRPDIVFIDDAENDEIVMNKERRDKFRRWFLGALLPCLSVKGIIRYVGTILHNDSMLESLMPKAWDRNTKRTGLKVSHDDRRAWKSVKYKAHTQDFTEILWPQNYNKEYFLGVKKEYTDLGYPDIYSQEYLNEPIDESLSYFKRNDFLAETEGDKKLSLKYYITADLAISKEESADYSVFVIAGMDEHRVIHVREVIRQRLDGREIVDTILNLEKVYRPEAIGIEEMQVSKAIGPFLREEMMRQDVFPSLVKLKHGGKDKMARAKSIQARLRAHTVKFDKSGEWYPDLEDECVMFPRAKHDDQVDSLAYLGMLLDTMVEAQTPEEKQEEEFEETYERNIGNFGRCATTGY